MPDDATIVSPRPDTTEAPAPKREAPQKQSERLVACRAIECSQHDNHPDTAAALPKQHQIGRAA